VAYDQTSDWSRWKYDIRFQGKLDGNNVASDDAGWGQSYSQDNYSQLAAASPSDPPTWQYQGTYGSDTDVTEQMASTFSRDSGQMVQLWGHVKVTEDGCTLSDLKLYVWS
jgi:hypothetical protein